MSLRFLNSYISKYLYLVAFLKEKLLCKWMHLLVCLAFCNANFSFLLYYLVFYFHIFLSCFFSKYLCFLSNYIYLSIASPLSISLYSLLSHPLSIYLFFLSLCFSFQLFLSIYLSFFSFSLSMSLSLTLSLPLSISFIVEATL